ncbi:hypothetical protein KVT40_003397 [Elsinoe batatas]|uniref:Uncharacterized protein n=1 Tax=Elsinoe batatas TaxID=2601811 RepID=A0A8K0L5V3_9PEZI|nr:hypothetical protein KVT40_003397 [Elsinoe batatas]
MDSSGDWRVHRQGGPQIDHVPFNHARQLFAVDASGSTSGSIIKHEHEFVKPLHCLGRDQVLTWGGCSNDPVFDLNNVQWSGNMGGTSPSTILSNANALSALNNSDVWYLLTDGEIWGADVPALFRLANRTGVINVPISRCHEHRRASLQWMLDNMLLKTGCRETFNELGPWVTYPEALPWAARDFQANGVDSWAIGYPLAGFTQLLSFGTRTGAFDDKVVAQMRVAKILHGFVSNYLALMFKHGNGNDHSWKQPVMATVYASFNASLVPTDRRGSASLVNDPAELFARLRAFLASDMGLLHHCSESEKFHLMRRAQLLSFWLLYHLPSHTKAKTFFATIRHSQALATTVLDVSLPALPDAAVIPTLTSIFRASDPADHVFFARHTSACQFASPFGASVLRYGFAACGEWFIQPEDLPSIDRNWTPKELEQLRQARAAHLVRAFAVDNTFGKLAHTGMPLPLDGKAPTSIHVNLHVSVARVWSQLNRITRQHILSGKVGHFIALVEKEVYGTGRGDVYQEHLARKIRVILPSFFIVLHDAAAREGAGRRAEDYEHDWRLNRLEVKAKWEMRAMEEAEWEADLVIVGGHE